MTPTRQLPTLEAMWGTLRSSRPVRGPIALAQPNRSSVLTTGAALEKTSTRAPVPGSRRKAWGIGNGSRLTPSRRDGRVPGYGFELRNCSCQFPLAAVVRARRAASYPSIAALIRARASPSSRRSESVLTILSDRSRDPMSRPQEL